MTVLFPAIFIGGPPHSGKSTLLYRLSQALRQTQVAHYALRASPDGEGDWTQEVDEPLVRELRLRSKDDWTPQLAARISRDIDQRHLPLLVDAGGKVTPENEIIAAACTHAVLLARNLDDLGPWRALLEQLGRPLIAELRSDLTGIQDVQVDAGVLRGTLSGLKPEQSSEGSCFTALVAQVRRHFDYSAEQLFRIHKSLTTAELVLNLEHGRAPAQAEAQRWYPTDIPPLLASLPPDAPLAFYGRGPMWLYSALGAFTGPEPQLFNPRHGWVTPPSLVRSHAPDSARLRWDSLTTHDDHTRLQLSIPGGYLDIADSADLPIPQVPPERGVALDGKLPGWLYVALARAYRGAAWVTVYQPSLGDIVILSHTPSIPVGTIRAPATRHKSSVA